MSDEKAPTTPFTAAFAHGVRLTSRYQKQDELTRMARVMDALPAAVRDCIASMECDSKATHSYAVRLHAATSGVPAAEQAIAQRIGHELCQVAGGHNGVYVGRHGVCDPDWNE